MVLIHSPKWKDCLQGAAEGLNQAICCFCAGESGTGFLGEHRIRIQVWAGLQCVFVQVLCCKKYSAKLKSSGNRLMFLLMCTHVPHEQMSTLNSQSKSNAHCDSKQEGESDLHVFISEMGLTTASQQK